MRIFFQAYRILAFRDCMSLIIRSIRNDEPQYVSYKKHTEITDVTYTHDFHFHPPSAVPYKDMHCFMQ